jgi:hypothetical protein
MMKAQDGEFAELPPFGPTAKLYLPDRQGGRLWAKFVSQPERRTNP